MQTVSLRPPKSKRKCLGPGSRTLNGPSYSGRNGVLCASRPTKTNLEDSKLFGQMTGVNGDAQGQECEKDPREGGTVGQAG